MRSDKIFGALDRVQNRYKLCQLTSQATRKFHRPNTRVQETMNEVLERFSSTADLEKARANQELPESAHRRAA